MIMNTYVVTLLSETGRERVERVVATTAQSASNQAILRLTRELGSHTYRVLHAIAE